MNLTINELERRLYIDGKLQEREALLTFEDAWDNAWDFATEDHLTAEAVADAGLLSMRVTL
jgi:hypothetical protein